MPDVALRKPPDARGEVQASVHPEFIGEPWVIDALVSVYRAGKLFERRRGRPRGVSPETWTRGLIIVALVEAIAKKEGKNRERVLLDLVDREIVGLCLSYDRLKHLYYEMRTIGAYCPCSSLMKPDAAS